MVVFAFMKVENILYPVPPEHDDPQFQRFFDYWVGLCASNGLAKKSDFDPLELVDILGQLNVIRVHYLQGRLRFEFTLWGTRNTQLFGGDLTGKFADEVFSATPVGTVDEVFEDMVIHRRPHFWHVPVPRPTRDFTAYRRLAVPFTDEKGERITDIVAFLIPDEED